MCVRQVSTVHLKQRLFESYMTLNLSVNTLNVSS